jgi:hypothetical protein
VHLVEVVIAAALLAAVCLSLPPAFAAAVRANRAAADVTFTLVLAAQKIEELRSQPFPDAPGVAEFSDVLDAKGNPVETLWQVPAYARTWRTEPLPAAPGQTIVITVIVAPYRYAARDVTDMATPGASRLVTLRTRRAP